MVLIHQYIVIKMRKWERYIKELNAEIDINKAYLLYNGIKVNEELTNREDKKMNIMI